MVDTGKLVVKSQRRHRIVCALARWSWQLAYWGCDALQGGGRLGVSYGFIRCFWLSQMPTSYGLRGLTAAARAYTAQCVCVAPHKNAVFISDCLEVSCSTLATSLLIRALHDSPSSSNAALYRLTGFGASSDVQCSQPPCMTAL